MLKNPEAQSVLAGVLSFLIFALSLLAATNGLPSIMLTFMPIVPLFLISFSTANLKLLTIAIASGGALSFLLASFIGASELEFLLSYLLMFAIPSIIVTWEYFKFRVIGELKLWEPSASAFTKLLAYISGLFVLVCLYLSDKGGMEEALGKVMLDATARIQEQMSPDAVPLMNKQLIFLVPAFPMCMWLVLTMLGAWLAHFTLFSYSRHIRLPFSITPEFLPAWVIIPLLVSGAMAVFASGQLGFMSKAIFCVWLMPYVMYSINLINKYSMKLPGRFFFLAIFYFILLNPVSLALMALFGIFKHLSAILHPRTIKY